MRSDDRLTSHLRSWLGAWPPRAGRVLVVGSAAREQPGWDGAVHDVVGVATADGAVLSVPSAMAPSLAAMAVDFDALLDAGFHRAVADAVGRPGAVLGSGVFRWCTEPAILPVGGEWVPPDDPRLPAWLRPFNGDVLVSWDGEGRYAAGVGRKQHDQFGHELSVGTEPSQQGRGLGRCLVAQAAQRVLDDGAVPTYLHHPRNVASARVAEAAGFPDMGWAVIGLWGDTPPQQD